MLGVGLTVLVVGVGLATLIVTTLGRMENRLTARIDGLDGRTRAVEVAAESSANGWGSSRAA